MNVPYDIIYNIYFYINDYSTLNNFWLLSKEFNKNYMTKYNKQYIYKYNILYNNLFTFLSSLPEKNSGKHDIDFYELVTTSSLSKVDKKLIKNDIQFIYKLYKNFFIYYLTSDLSKLSNMYFLNISDSLSNVLIIQGPEFINKLINITINKNKVSIKSKHNNKIITLKNMMMYYKGYNLAWLRQQIEKLEDIM